MNAWTKFWVRIRRQFSSCKANHPRVLLGLSVALSMLAVYGISKTTEVKPRVVHVERDGQFRGKRIMGDTPSSVYEAKERSLNKTAMEVLQGQKKLSNDLEKLADRLAVIEVNKGQGAIPSPTVTTSSQQTSADVSSDLSPQPALLPTVQDSRAGSIPPVGFGGAALMGITPTHRIPSRGPDVVSFPVSAELPTEEQGIVLPVGSYVRAKIIAGTDATTGDPDPVLLQLDYSHILPNQRKIDLSGCFMTAKAQADLSIERVKMKTMKLSCVSRRGMVFEREVNGYVADDTDNKFAVSGPVNSKQDRVAAMAFLASVVEGVGKAVQQAQNTQRTTTAGDSQSVMTGDEHKYIAGGAAANAAGMVAQWYLKQAESLLPSITVGSGRDVWIVVLDNVNLPTDYFAKGNTHDSRSAYVSRILD